MPLLVDFGSQELKLLRYLWHSKIGQLFDKTCKDEENLISCNLPKYWLEEADSLSLPETDQSKLRKLCDLVDDIDSAMKSVRSCITTEQVTEVINYAMESISPLLSFESLEELFTASGTPQDITEKQEAKQAPIEYLKARI